jgi:hypothetical protein
MFYIEVQIVNGVGIGHLKLEGQGIGVGPFISVQLIGLLIGVVGTTTDTE